MLLRAVAVASVIVLAFAAMSASAQAQTRPNQSTAKTKKTEVPQPVREPAPEGRIACTVSGCHPIPANCTTTMGQTPMGATGYEIVHCP